MNRSKLIEKETSHVGLQQPKSLSQNLISRGELRNYPQFMHIIERFRDYYGLTGISRKKLDQFLWIEGKGFASRRK